MEVTIMELNNRQAADTASRLAEIKKTELELWSTFGSKITRWERVHDVDKDCFVYLNVDTLAVSISLSLLVCVRVCELCLRSLSI